jgi:hypothetical protein
MKPQFGDERSALFERELLDGRIDLLNGAHAARMRRRAALANGTARTGPIRLLVTDGVVPVTASDGGVN